MIKYTKDGKKVKVIGSLNNSQTIVQEILVTDDGVEVPSGKNIVVEILTDKPTMTWKEKNIIKVEEEMQQKKEELKRLESEYKVKSYLVKEKLRFLKNLTGNISEKSLDRLISFLSGNITHVIYSKHNNNIEILEFDNEIINSNEWWNEGLKLASVFGDTKGNLTYKINRWSDGSGSDRVFEVAESYEEALKIAKRLFDDRLERGVSDALIECAKRFNFHIPEDKLNDYHNQKRITILKDIKNTESKLQEYKNKLKEIEQ